APCVARTMPTAPFAVRIRLPTSALAANRGRPGAALLIGLRVGSRSLSPKYVTVLSPSRTTRPTHLPLSVPIHAYRWRSLEAIARWGSTLAVALQEAAATTK